LRLHIMPFQGVWAVRREGDPEPMSTHRTLDKAQDWVARKAHATQVLVHGEDGQLRDLVLG
jgi:hypothetical protein